MVSQSGARCRLFAYGPADATAIPRPHHLLPRLNADWFYLSGTGLPRLSWKTGRQMGSCSSNCIISLCAISCAFSSVGYSRRFPRRFSICTQDLHASNKTAFSVFFQYSKQSQHVSSSCSVHTRHDTDRTVLSRLEGRVNCELDRAWRSER